MLVSEAFDFFIFKKVRLEGGADKTRRNYESGCKSFVAALGDFPVELLTIDHVTRWQMHMASRGNENSSIKGNLGKLRSVLRYLKKERRMNVMDYRDIELPPVRRKEIIVLDYTEVQQIMDAATNLRDKAIVACLFSTGCRISELLNLDKDSIEDDVAMVMGKGSKPRPVYFDQTAIQAVQAYLDTRHDKIPALFISGQYRRITVSRVEQILHCLAAEAGVEKNVTPHLFRHSTITDYLANGAEMHEVKGIAGHASIQTTVNIYGHLQEKHSRETFRKYHTRR